MGSENAAIEYFECPIAEDNITSRCIALRRLVFFPVGLIFALPTGSTIFTKPSYMLELSMELSTWHVVSASELGGMRRYAQG